MMFSLGKSLLCLLVLSWATALRQGDPDEHDALQDERSRGSHAADGFEKKAERHNQSLLQERMIPARPAGSEENAMTIMWGEDNSMWGEVAGESAVASQAQKPPVQQKTKYDAMGGWKKESLDDSLSVVWNKLRQWSFLIAMACLYALYSPKGQAKTAASDTAALSGFRALLAVWVFTEHLGLHPVNGGGAFVILSGCVLSTSRRNAQTGLVKSPVTGLQTYVEFVWMRLWRVLPLYYFYFSSQKAAVRDGKAGPLEFIMGTGENWLRFPHDYPKAFVCWWPTMGTLGYYGIKGHLWFVGVIVHLYVLYPILEFIALGTNGSQRPAWAWLTFVFVACAVMKIAEVVYLPTVLVNGIQGPPFLLSNGLELYSCPFLRIPEFMLGIIVPHLALSEDMLKTSFQRVAAYGAVIICDLFLVGLLLWSWLWPKTMHMYFLTDLNAQAPLVALVLWGLCFGPAPSLIGRLLSTSWLIVLGEWGYGIYLWHVRLQVEMGVYHHRFPPCDGKRSYTMPACGVRAYGPDWQWPAAGACFALSCLMAWTTFRLIEEPFQSGGRRLLLAAKGDWRQLLFISQQEARTASERAAVGGAASVTQEDVLKDGHLDREHLDREHSQAKPVTARPHPSAASDA